MVEKYINNDPYAGQLTAFLREMNVDLKSMLGNIEVMCQTPEGRTTLLNSIRTHKFEDPKVKKFGEQFIANQIGYFRAKQGEK